MDTSDLAKRMKDYESISKSKLMKRCPVMVRIDGKAHHTFTHGFQRPYDEVYMRSIQETAKYLCEHIQGVILSYQQSDEITLVLVDYKTINVSPYFDYEVQKLCSIIASMTTMAFNKIFRDNVNTYYACCREYGWLTDEIQGLCDVYFDAVDRGAMFDCRVFNIPKDEVTNNIYWRQLDATRNSIQMVGQANFSHAELQNKTCDMIQDMLMIKCGINWNDMPVEFKRGSCCIKQYYYVDTETGEEIADYNAVNVVDMDTLPDNITQRSRWIVDKNIPVFKGEGRNYIEKLVIVGE